MLADDGQPRIVPLQFDDHHHGYYNREYQPRTQPMDNQVHFDECTVKKVRVRINAANTVEVKAIVTSRKEAFEITRVLRSNGPVKILRSQRLILLEENSPTTPPSSSGIDSDGSNDLYRRGELLIIKHFEPNAFVDRGPQLENPEMDITVTQFFTNHNYYSPHQLYNQHKNVLHAIATCYCKADSVLSFGGYSGSTAMNVEGEDGEDKSPNMKRSRLTNERFHVYMVIPFFEGQDMIEYIQSNGPLTEDAAKMMMRDLVHGLSWMHRFGVSHRDFSAENILYDPTNDRWTIIDFGLAYRCEPHLQPVHWKGRQYPSLRPSDQEIQYHMNHEPLPTSHVIPRDYTPYSCWIDRFRSVVGKDYCLAPELYECNGNIQINPLLLDIWVLGIILCLAVFGNQPLVSGDPEGQYENEETGLSEPCPYFANVRDKNLQSTYSPELGYSEVSEELFDLIHRLLSVNPIERPSFEEILSHQWMAGVV